MNDRSAADRALTRELDALSRGYRNAPGDAPPADIDRAVIARARDRAGRRRRLPTWWVPATLAAMVVIAFSLMLRVQQDAVMAPAGREAAGPVADATRTAPAEAPVRATGTTLSEPAPQVAAQAPRATPAPASAEADALPEPEAWLSKIEALEAEGLMQEAATERERFEQAYPGWLEQRARSRD